VVACLLHWYTSALYAVPPVGMVGWVWLSGWRGRRREHDGPGIGPFRHD
jgi:hypothetical protein